MLVDRIAARGVEVRRLDHDGLHAEAVTVRHLQQLGIGEPVFRQHVRRIQVDRARFRAVRRVQPHLGRRGQRAPGVDVVREAGVEARAWLPPRSDSLVRRDRRAARGTRRSRYGCARCRTSRCPLHAVERAAPTPRWCLLQELAVPVVVQVLPPAALAQPEERSVGEPARRAVHVDPRFGGLPQQARGPTRVRERQVQVEPGLLPVLHLEHHAPAVRRPPDVDDQWLARRVLVQFNPGDVAAGGPDDAEAHGRVWITRLRVFPVLDLGVVFDVIDDRELRHPRIVELQERQLRGVGAPPVAAEVAPAVDLLLVHPVEQAVPHVRRAVGCESVRAPVLDVGDMQIVIADERQQPAVRAEGDFLFLLRRARQAHDPGAVGLVVVQVVGEAERHRRPVPVHRRQQRPALPRQTPRVGRADAGQGGDGRRHRVGVKQQLACSRRRVDLEHPAVRRRLQIVQVVEPLQVAGRAAVEIDPLRGVEDGVDGELLLGVRGGCQADGCGRRKQHRNARGSVPNHV